MELAVADHEVQTQQQGNWVTQTTTPDKEEAMGIAKQLFSNPACTGVRVVQITAQSDGNFITNELMCETRVIKVNESIKSSRIDWAPPACQKIDEYYHTDARRLMGRVMRDYCDKMVVTPTEILYSIKEASRLQDRGTLVLEVVDKVAVAQTTDSTEARARAQVMNAMVVEIMSRARRADRMSLPKIEKSFAETLAKSKQIETMGEDWAYVAMVALARDLSTFRNWLGKLYRLCLLLQEDQNHPDAVRMLDGVIGDCVSGAVVQDILGYQENLAKALVAMLDIAEGKFIPEKSDAGIAAGIITMMCGKNKLPITKQSLIERVHRQMVTGVSLNRADPENEMDAYKTVAERLIRPTGLYSGPDTAEAMTARYCRMLEKGGKLGRNIAFTKIFFSMPDRTSSIHYLCDIARTMFAEDLAESIMEKYDSIQNLRSFNELTRPTLPLKERLIRFGSARKVVATSVFPDAVKARLVAHLDLLLDKFITSSQILEKMDAPTAPLKDRAVAMGQFCALGVLPPKVLDRFRERLGTLMATADFEKQFLGAYPDAAQGTKALQLLHNVMDKK